MFQASCGGSGVHEGDFTVCVVCQMRAVCRLLTTALSGYRRTLVRSLSLCLSQICSPSMDSLIPYVFTSSHGISSKEIAKITPTTLYPSLIFSCSSVCLQLENLDNLTPKQVAGLMADNLPGLPEKEVIINTVFDHLLESPVKRGLPDVLQNLLIISQKVKFTQLFSMAVHQTLVRCTSVLLLHVDCLK